MDLETAVSPEFGSGAARKFENFLRFDIDITIAIATRCSVFSARRLKNINRSLSALKALMDASPGQRPGLRHRQNRLAP
jgi:hypothetical protein